MTDYESKYVARFVNNIVIITNCSLLFRHALGFYHYLDLYCFFFFFQAEDGIRDIGVTGVQTCALPISEGVYVAEVIVVLSSLEDLEDVALHGGGRERQIGARDPLGHRHDIRLDAVVLVAETPARPAETADHLVNDEQDAALFADPRDFLDVAVGRDEDTAAGDDGLHDDPCHRLGQLPLDGALYGAGALQVARGARSEERRVGKEGRSRWSPYH